MRKLYYTVYTPLIEAEDFMVAEGYKSINVYSIVDGELDSVLTLDIDLDMDSEQEIMRELCSYSDIELILI